MNKSVSAEWVENSRLPLLFRCIALSGKYGKKCRLQTVLFLGPLKLFAIFYVPNTLRLYLVRIDQSILTLHLWIFMSGNVNDHVLATSYQWL